MAEEPRQPATVPATSSGRGGIVWTPRLVIWTVVLVILLVFILQNWDKVNLNILFWEFDSPLAIILLVFSLAGYALGWMRPRFRSRRSA